MKPLIEIILQVIIYTPVILFLIFLYFLFFNKKRGKKGGAIRFIYHIRKKKLLRPEYSASFIFSSALYIFCFYWSVDEKIYINVTPEIATAYVYLFLKSLFTPTTLIAILGPTILALNYNLFVGHIGERRINSSNPYSEMYRTRWSEFIDTQFAHTFELNALIIAWGAFAYQIISNPLTAIEKLIMHIKLYYLQNNIVCNEIGWLEKFPNLSEFSNECMKFIRNELLSVIVISLAIGFVIWIFRRLISGQLSRIREVELYERYWINNRLERRYPSLANRITLYRIILVLFSYLYLAWSEYYITYNIAQNILVRCSAGSIELLKRITKLSEIPKNPEVIIFILLIVLFIITIIIGLHFIAVFKYELSNVVIKSKMYRRMYAYNQG